MTTSAVKGMRSPPGPSVKASGLKRSRLPKLPKTPTPAEWEELSAEYLTERNAAMRSKRLKADMELASARGELIEKRLVERQLAFLLIAFRQALLRLPIQLRTKWGPEVMTHERSAECKELVTRMLTALADLPNCAEANWLKKLEEEE